MVAVIWSSNAFSWTTKFSDNPIRRSVPFEPWLEADSYCDPRTIFGQNVLELKSYTKQNHTSNYIVGIVPSMDYRSIQDRYGYWYALPIPTGYITDQSEAAVTFTALTYNMAAARIKSTHYRYDTTYGVLLNLGQTNLTCFDTD